MELKDRHDIVRCRLQNQRLVGKPFGLPQGVVAFHLAMQSQDFAGAQWGIAQRLPEAAQGRVQAAFDAGKIVRTHVLRPTWHFVAAADVRWLLELTAPRVRAISLPYNRKHGLDAATLRKSRRVVEKQLAGGAQRTREELGTALINAGLPGQGEALTLQMIAAELDAVIVSGAQRGKQHTYALLEERVPDTAKKTREEALAELSLRYLQSHGPALPQDLAWWSGLTIADAKRGIAACGKAVHTADVDGKSYFFTPARRSTVSSPVVHLLPNYDEQLIAYRFRGNAVLPEVAKRVGPGDGIFSGNLLLIDGLLAGGWRRELGKSHVDVTVRPLRKLSRAETRALELAAERYASFVQLKLKLSVR